MPKNFAALLRPRASPLAAFIQSLAPRLEYRFNETSGLTLINYGVLGASFNGVIGDTAGVADLTIAQSGPGSVPNEAYDFDQEDSVITTPAVPYYPSWTLVSVLKVTSVLVAAQTRRFYDIINGVHLLGARSTGQIEAKVTTTGTAENILTTTTLLTYPTPWLVFFQQFSTANRMRLFIGQNGAVTQPVDGYVAGTGNMLSGSQTLKIGNNQVPNRAHRGPVAHLLYFNFEWSAQQKLDFVRLLGI